MDRKSILFIIPWLPYPLKSGGHQALFNGIYAVRNDFEVHIAYEAENDDDYLNNEEEFLELIPNAHLYPFFYDSYNQYPYWLRIAYRVKAFIKKLLGRENGKADKVNVACASWLNSVLPLREAWLEHVSIVCNKNHFDIIQIEMPWFISQILTLPQESRKVFVHHELGFVRRELEQKQFEKNEYVNACRTFADKAEIGLLNMYDAVVTLSPIDKEKLLSNGVNVPVYSSFAIINLQNTIDFRIIDGKCLSFVGPSSHSPNYIGISWFLENCWYNLKKMDASYRLKVIGNWEEECIKDLSSRYSDVKFVGFVDNLEDEIKGTIMIVPITIGSGIRMKILEACSIGVPFVSTSVGAEGIPVVSGTHCYIADNPDDFVSSLVKLQQISIQKNFVCKAREMVEKNYSKDALRNNRLNIYSDILRQRLLEHRNQ